jgi:hypothetical protein
MTFPIPGVYTSDAQDIARDELKRLASPPSFFTVEPKAYWSRGVGSPARYVRGSDAQIAQQYRLPT